MATCHPVLVSFAPADYYLIPEEQPTRPTDSRPARHLKTFEYFFFSLVKDVLTSTNLAAQVTVGNDTARAVTALGAPPARGGASRAPLGLAVQRLAETRQ